MDRNNAHSICGPGPPICLPDCVSSSCCRATSSSVGVGVPPPSGPGPGMTTLSHRRPATPRPQSGWAVASQRAGRANGASRSERCSPGMGGGPGGGKRNRRATQRWHMTAVAFPAIFFQIRENSQFASRKLRSVRCAGCRRERLLPAAAELFRLLFCQGQGRRPGRLELRCCFPWNVLGSGAWHKPVVSWSWSGKLRQ